LSYHSYVLLVYFKVMNFGFYKCIDVYVNVFVGFITFCFKYSSKLYLENILQIYYKAGLPAATHQTVGKK